MNLVDIYVREVGLHLPEKLRLDIQKEIRSLIEDSLEDQSRETGRPVDEAMVVDVLQRMGPPEKVAASYLPPRYLIGPELFPHFVSTLRVVLTIVSVLAAIGLGLSMASKADPARGFVDLFIDLLGTVFGGVVEAVINATAIVVLVFAIIQWVSPGLKIPAQPWDPRKLRLEPDPERVSLPSVLADAVMNVIALIVFNLYPEWIGFSTIQDGVWVHAPLLSEAFFGYLPFLSLLWVLDTGLNIWLAARGRWSSAQRWASLTLSLLTIGVWVWMLAGPSLIAVDANTFAQMGWDLPPDAAASLVMALNLSVRLVLGLMIALGFLDAGKQLYKLLRSRLPEPLALR
jgi:hypothetical protein